MAELFEVIGKKIWVLTEPPKLLLPPEVNIRISMNEIIDLALNEYRRIYYERSGRFLGIFDTKEGEGLADPYRFAGKFIPGGRLPWEI